ncbi:class D beta-lactamase [Pseudomonas sp. 1152_12]
MLLKPIFFLAGLLIAVPALAVELRTSPAINEVFNKAEVSGTFVLYDANTQQWVGHNEKRAETRYTPASTFKIPNSLIGLHTGSVGSLDEVFYRYDGQPQMLKAWEKDMNVREAIATSNVKAYQLLARRVGLAPMQANLNALDYGNRAIGKSVETFWLDDSLRISAIEQVEFLTRLAQGKLPYPVSLQADVREIIKLETGTTWSLYGKTGWAGKQDPGIGWFVGWVEQAGNIYVFALNIDVPRDSEPPALPTALAKRIDVAKASLAAAGVDLAPNPHTYRLSEMLPSVTDKNAPARSLQAYEQFFASDNHP